MASNWNRATDRLLEADLTLAEHRLGLAIVRFLQGWNREEHQLGEKLLRRKARLHGRSFERARAGLVAKQVICFTPGSGRGRGSGGTYSMVLEMPAPERAIEGRPDTDEMPAPERAIKEPSPKKVNARSRDTEMPALERVLRGSKGNTPASPQTSPKSTPTTNTEIGRRCFEAYLGAGGNLELDGHRKTLGRSVKDLAHKGIADAVLIAACKALGKGNEFPGYLKQRVEEILQDGLPCTWASLDRLHLTPAQLAECGCNGCGEWIQLRAAEPKPDRKDTFAWITRQKELVGERSSAR